MGRFPSHDESGSGQVELYVVLEGDAILRLGGEEHAAPVGTVASISMTIKRLASISARPRRGLRARP